MGERRWVNAALGGLAWITALIFFFPVFWMVLNSFKSEQDANTSPTLSFDPTLDRYSEVTESTGADKPRTGETPLELSLNAGA